MCRKCAKRKNKFCNWIFILFFILFFSDAVVNLKHVQGKCFIAYEKNLKCSTSQWFNEGQYRFYFNEAYDSKLKTFHKPTSVALNLGKIKNVRIKINYV